MSTGAKQQLGRDQRGQTAARHAAGRAGVEGSASVVHDAPPLRGTQTPLPTAQVPVRRL